jgi:thiol-disulfide isomerase/thioredoxin
MISFLKKNLSNILFIGFIIFLFTPLGMPVRALFIKGVSFVTTRILPMEIEESSRIRLGSYDWNLIDLNGEMINFTSFENKVVVVNFWATWCPPCVAEMPSFQKLYEEYGEEVVFLFVANDKKSKVEAFIHKHQYSFPVYFQASAVPEEMNSNSLPTTFIIAKNGDIVVKKTGAADWHSGKARDLLLGLLQ